MEQDTKTRTDEAQARREMAASELQENREPSSPAMPVVVCGKTEQVGRIVIASLKPEYDVIHFITSPTSGASILPALLESRTPPFHVETSTIGSGNYAAAPRAVILGAAFDDAAATVLQEAVADARARSSAGVRTVPWLRNDPSKPAPPRGGPGYGEAVVSRVREALVRLEDEGKLDGSYGGDEWY
ncbi:hypothetical protein LX32DRAFT_640926 [Colletotrichum zoysiae]|uniref:Uncharacterized protein n=1 Tax=Colletotrichum zoysiae TaxID=1216348 RepID=A0AAD9M3K4_9PEZI|nr:hypothetical protein LX32DRAFT_640926 [Colletotrichum zoysiae]